MIRRRLAALSVLALATAAGFSASQAVADGPAPSVPAPVERVEQYYVTGPSADYAVDTGAIGTVDPVVWDLPGDAARSAVVEASFQYRTIGAGPFVVTLRVHQVGGETPAVEPAQLTLAPAPDGDTTSVRFLVPDVPGGHTYKAFVSVNSHPTPGHNRIATRKLLVTVELSPS